VSYNSDKWTNNCLQSIKDSQYCLDNISIFIVDNNSDEKSKKFLDIVSNKYVNYFNKLEIIKQSENLGFGRANNIGFEYGDSEYVFFLNIDTEIHTETFNKLEEDIKNSGEEVAIWELRQFPYEHPKNYDPLTRYTNWSSGAAFVIKRNIFKAVNGFDKNIFMYAEDVDLSWRLRLLGYKLKYVPEAIVYHYSYVEAYEVKPNQYINSIVNNIFLRYKFGSLKDVLIGHAMFVKLLFKRGPFGHSRKKLIEKFFSKYFNTVYNYLVWRFTNKSQIKERDIKFIGWDYELSRRGEFYENKLPQKSPLVSILVRTCGRPNVLREALISLRNQTYKNIEIVIIEDGENLSQRMIKEEFNDLNIIYKYTERKVGRCVVGNIAMETSNGEYLNFLDDDDVLYPEHVEVLVSQLVEFKKDIGYSLAYETPIKIFNKDPYTYKLKDYRLVFNQPFNKLLLFYNNYLPIQTVMFKKTLYVKYGGLDTGLDVLEDWDLWCRYAVDNDFLYVNKITSQYRVPYDKTIYKSRRKLLLSYTDLIRKRYSDAFLTREIDLPDFETDIKFNIEEIVRLKDMDKKYYRISGWAFDDKKIGIEQPSIYIVLKSDFNTYIYKTSLVKRLDVSNVFDMQLDYSGFTTYVCKDDIIHGEYVIGICICGDKIAPSLYYTNNNFNTGN